MHLPRPAMKAMKAMKATILGLAVAAAVVQEAVPEAPARELICKLTLLGYTNASTVHFWPCSPGTVRGPPRFVLAPQQCARPRDRVLSRCA